MRTVLFVVAALTAVSAQGTGPAPRAYFTEPAISPDRSEIAFISGGDIWAVPVGGRRGAAAASRIPPTSRARSTRPMASGSRSSSNRTGGGDIYVLTLRYRRA